MDLVIERAGLGDAAAIMKLLEERDLPLDGLAQHLVTAVVARSHGHVVGSAALEVYADGALLRSVAVAPDHQRLGLGAGLTNAALGLARDLGVHTVYLLTTTADRYFPKFGFERITRTDVPASVQASVEFTSACPASAIVMRKRL